MQIFVSLRLKQREMAFVPKLPLFELFLAPFIFIFCSVPGQSEMAHTIVL